MVSSSMLALMMMAGVLGSRARISPRTEAAKYGG
jgi:hypothetical protein